MPRLSTTAQTSLLGHTHHKKPCEGPELFTPGFPAPPPPSRPASPCMFFRGGVCVCVFFRKHPSSLSENLFFFFLDSKTSYRLFSVKFRVTEKKRRMVRHKTAFVSFSLLSSSQKLIASSLNHIKLLTFGHFLTQKMAVLYSSAENLLPGWLSYPHTEGLSLIRAHQLCRETRCKQSAVLLARRPSKFIPPALNVIPVS